MASIQFLDLTGVWGLDPIYLSAQHGANSVLELFIDEDATATISFGESYIIPTVYLDNIDAVMLLHQHGAKLDAKDDMNRTALHFAADYGAIKCMKYLIDNGLSHRSVDATGKTPLFNAVNHPDCLKLLLSEGAEVNIRGRSGNTAMFYCKM